jgi:hypothetical protein
VDTLKRLAKKSHFGWKRLRKSLKKKRNKTLFQEAEQEINALRKQQQAGDIDVYFFDESGYSVKPVVPYAWQPKGYTLSLLPAKSERLICQHF